MTCPHARIGHKRASRQGLPPSCHLHCHHPYQDQDQHDSPAILSASSRTVSEHSCFSPSYSSVSSCPPDPHLGGTMNIEYWLPCDFIGNGWSLQQRGETFQSWIYWSLSCPMDESCWFSPSHIATTHDCRATNTLTHWENLVKHAFVKHRDILQIHPS